MSAQERRDRIAEEPWLVNVANPAEKPEGKGSFRAVWERRELVVLLSRREIRARYKDSSLGMLWSLARPLAQFAVYYFALGKVLGLSRQIPDFAIFVFVGLTGWVFFSETIQKAASSIVHNAGLIKKVQLPRQVFPLAAGGSVLFTTAIQLLVVLVAIVLMGKIPSVDDLGYAVAGALLLIILSYGVGVFLSAVNVYFRDVEHLIEVSLVVFFWASPIVYSFKFVHEQLQGNWIEQLYLSNPITIAIMALQRGLWKEGSSEGATVWPEYFEARLAGMFVLSAIMVWFSHRVFARLEGNFAQEI